MPNRGVWQTSRRAPSPAGCSAAAEEFLETQLVRHLLPATSYSWSRSSVGMAGRRTSWLQGFRARSCRRAVPLERDQAFRRRQGSVPLRFLLSRPITIRYGGHKTLLRLKLAVKRGWNIKVTTFNQVRCQPRPNVFLRPFSTGPAGMKRRNLASREASPLGVRRIFQAPKAASTMVSATPSGSGAFWTFF